MSNKVKCELCGEPMPNGEEMFKFHGYSGPCPKPPLAMDESLARRDTVSDELIEAEFNIGKWLSAALDDPNVCAEMKLDITRWFTAIEKHAPPATPDEG